MIRKVISLILNAAIVVLGVIGLTIVFKADGLYTLSYYTTESNLLAVVASSVMCVSLIWELSGGKTCRWVRVLKYVSACCLMLALSVVLLGISALDELGGFSAMMLEGSRLYQHLLCPLLSVGSYIFCEGLDESASLPLLSLIPTLVYGLVMGILNVIGVADGPYPFMRFAQQGVLISAAWVVLIAAYDVVLSWGIAALGHKMNKCYSDA